MVPPRVPQFNWVDLGLPSGTLWLDRPLGAKNVGDPGLMYQWGALVGYMTATQSNSTLAQYEEQGLNLITGDLTTEHDAAAMYYGGAARVPSVSDLEELIENTSISISDHIAHIRSNINGNSIHIRTRGRFINQNDNRPTELYIWANSSIDEQNAQRLHVDADQVASITGAIPRFYGLLILPVKFY